MPTDFSYERDVQAYIPRFFSEIRQDKNLSPQSVERLQTGVLKTAQDIELQRMKLVEERDQSLLRKLSAEQTMLHLDDFRRRQKREEQEAQEAGATAEAIRGITQSNLPDYDKRAKLRDLTLSNLGTASRNPVVQDMLRLTNAALPDPKDQFTPAQYIEMGLKGVPNEVIASGDPTLIGRFMAVGAEAEAERELRTKATMERMDKDEAEQRRVLHAPLKFQKDTENPEAPQRWLEDESQLTAKVIVERWGTPDEKKEFYSSKDNDPDRARIANDVRFRVLVGDGGQPDKREAVRSKFFQRR